MIRIWYFIKDLRYLPHTIKIGITNLFVWFPVIWNDRQWDYIYILRMLHKKLSMMEKFIREDGIHVKNKRDAHKIKVCVLLLERMIEDVYHDHAYENHYKKWGDPHIKFLECEYEDCHEIKFEYKNVKTEEDEKQKFKEFRRCMKHERYLTQQDLDLLFKMMNKHITSWWD